MSGGCSSPQKSRVGPEVPQVLGSFFPLLRCAAFEFILVQLQASRTPSNTSEVHADEHDSRES